MQHNSRCGQSAAWRRPSRPVCRRCLRIPVVANGQPRISPERHILPIVPLGMVALPNATIPLTLPAGSQHAEFFKSLHSREVASTSGPQSEAWQGTRRFGLCLAEPAPDSEGVNISPIGTTLGIKDFAVCPDGKLSIVTKGEERFRIVAVVKKEPILLCEVEVLEEEEDGGEAVQLAAAVKRLIPNYLRVYIQTQTQDLAPTDLHRFHLSLGLSPAPSSTSLTPTSLSSWLATGAPHPQLEALLMSTLSQTPLEELDLRAMGPRDLSFFVASLFRGLTELQQHLLQEGSTVTRLQIEKEMLQGSP